jgi:hypothetical protein
MDVTVDFPAERIVEPAIYDTALTPRQIAERDVAALGLTDASWKWAHIASQHPKHDRTLSILGQIVKIASAQVPRDKRPVFVVSLFANDTDARLFDVVVVHMPTPPLALGAGLLTINMTGKMTIDRSAHHAQVIQADEVTVVETVFDRRRGRRQ